MKIFTTQLFFICLTLFTKIRPESRKHTIFLIDKLSQNRNNISFLKSREIVWASLSLQKLLVGKRNQKHNIFLFYQFHYVVILKKVSLMNNRRILMIGICLYIINILLFEIREFFLEICFSLNTSELICWK